MALHWIASPRAWGRVARAVVLAPREPVTLEQLRGDLSHEPASKLARLAGLLQQWRRGQVLTSDARDAAEILDDLDRLFLRHARFAAAGFGTLAGLVSVMARAAELRRGFARAAGPRPPAAAHERIAAALEAMREGAQALVEALSARHAARLAELVREGAEEAARESRGAAVAVDVDTSAADGGAWVPRAEAAMWRDLVRNLVRNGVQASEERLAREDAPAARRVAVSVRPSAASGGVALEVIDAGAGMTPAQAEAMWRAGASSRGSGHGQGLTEAKLEFARARAALEVRTEPGAGTCVRLDVPRRGIALRRPALLALGPVQWTLLLAAALVVPLGWWWSRTDIASVEFSNVATLIARDRSGLRLWRQGFDEEVLPNNRGGALLPVPRRGDYVSPLVLARDAPGGAGVLLATKPLIGNAVVRRLNAKGRQMWEHPVEWAEPNAAFMSRNEALIAAFELPVAWNGDSAGAFVVNVRRGNWSPTSLLFLSAAGDSLGAYYHPGQLEYCYTLDFDRDGRYETLFNGVNNAAARSREFLAEEPGEIYVDCLVLLDPPRASGQAWPHDRWRALPPAREKAYLLFPPLKAGVRPEIQFLRPLAWEGPGRPRVEVTLTDGRIYALDEHLRPIACGVGDFTKADSLGLARAMGPFLYVREGTPERIDIPIGGE